MKRKHFDYKLSSLGKWLAFVKFNNDYDYNILKRDLTRRRLLSEAWDQRLQRKATLGCCNVAEKYNYTVSR